MGLLCSDSKEREAHCSSSSGGTALILQAGRQSPLPTALMDLGLQGLPQQGAPGTYQLLSSCRRTRLVRLPRLAGMRDSLLWSSLSCWSRTQWATASPSSDSLHTEIKAQGVECGGGGPRTLLAAARVGNDAMQSSASQQTGAWTGMGHAGQGG